MKGYHQRKQCVKIDSMRTGPQEKSDASVAEVGEDTRCGRSLKDGVYTRSIYGTESSEVSIYKAKLRVWLLHQVAPGKVISASHRKIPEQYPVER
jgi:hypothetical protein